MSGNKWKVTYFNGRGRAESTRIILTEAEVLFEDVRISKEQWDAMKQSTPTHTLPILELDDGTVLSQSPAILRFLGRKFNMYSDDLMEQYRIDLVMNIIDDLVDKKLIPALFEKDPVLKAEKMKKVEADDLPGYMKLLTNELKAGGNGFFVGTKLSIADVKVFTVLENISSNFPETMAKCNDLREFKERIASRPKIADWIKGRPETWF
ncbi:glutathione S-transferase 1-like [Mizuhopecten yessoensis]|uniref:S-crystallin SL11 n=1 Tax=Mizuhopecten yessoensis TaxID=6573 RepID=A0A210QIA7_MIZYE|nr:glutathione S-transferase 1-like [Mizuhopecten yessoensis]OWF48494.1 S-crystallin SL11 [Mizuhopecten yessoensis]